jgi:hypothetical protein
MIDKQEAHKEIMGLWDRYQEFTRNLCLLRGNVTELESDLTKLGQKLYQLYKSSDNGLDREGDGDDQNTQ